MTSYDSRLKNLPQLDQPRLVEYDFYNHRCPRTAAVRSHGVPVQLLYGERLCRTFSITGWPLSTVTIISVQPLYSTGKGPYSSCTVPMWHRTLAVWCRHCTVQRFYRFMMTKFAPVPNFKIVCTRTQMIEFYLFNQSRLIQLL